MTATASQFAARRRVYADAAKWQLLLDHGAQEPTWAGPYCWDGAASWVYVGAGRGVDVYACSERIIVLDKLLIEN